MRGGGWVCLIRIKLSRFFRGSEMRSSKKLVGRREEL